MAVISIECERKELAADWNIHISFQALFRAKSARFDVQSFLEIGLRDNCNHHLILITFLEGLPVNQTSLECTCKQSQAVDRVLALFSVGFRKHQPARRLEITI